MWTLQDAISASQHEDFIKCTFNTATEQFYFTQMKVQLYNISTRDMVTIGKIVIEIELHSDIEILQ